MSAAARGFALVSAIFLIVVLSVLGGFLVQLVAVQHATPALRVRAARADYAARSGLEWAARRALDSGACAASSSFDLAGTGLDGYRVTVRCTRSEHDLDGVTLPYFLFDVSAESGTYGGPDFVSRSLQAKVAGA